MTQPASVATVIGPPSRALVRPSLLDKLLQAASAWIGAPARIRVLAPDHAVDIFFPSTDDAARTSIAKVLCEAANAEPIDVIVQPTAFRRKKLLVADMDSTMIGQECIDELAGMAGFKERVAAITERAMRGDIAFEPALRERVALLKNLEETVVAEVLAKRITLTPGGRELVATMRANGAYAALVSGGFRHFTGQIAAKIGFNDHRANTLLVERGRLTGAVAEPILGRDAKLAALQELRTQFELRKEETLAIGDGANDLPMLLEAGLGVAFHAKPMVAAAAQARIDHGDLTSVLYAQGYTRDEILVSP